MSGVRAAPRRAAQRVVVVCVWGGGGEGLGLPSVVYPVLAHRDPLLAPKIRLPLLSDEDELKVVDDPVMPDFSGGKRKFIVRSGPKSRNSSKKR